MVLGYGEGRERTILKAEGHGSVVNIPRVPSYQKDIEEDRTPRA